MSTKKTILDIFSQISNDKEAEKPDLCIRLWNHLNSLSADTYEVDENNIPKEVTYAIRRLVQGLGSSRAPIRNSYFATLVILLSKTNISFGTFSLDCFKEIVDKQLSKCDSKGEEGEVLTGRTLAYGVAMRSGVFLKGSVELQKEIVSEMLTKSKERSYLPLLAYTFITDFINSVDEAIFKEVIWPVLSLQVLVQWPSQTFETLYCLLETQNKHPSILKKKIILSTFSTPSILHENTVENVMKMLTNITWEPCLKHPVYQTVGRCFVEAGEEVVTKFWQYVEQDLCAAPPRLKLLAVFTIFSSVVKTLDLKYVPSLLTSTFVDNLINSCRSSVNKNDKLCTVGKSTLQLIVTRATEKTEGSAAIVYDILCKLIFESGHILIDKLTGVKVVSPFVSKLDAKHVKLLAKKCEHVILQKSKQKEKKTETQKRWNFKDRCYAAQLLARLISHPESQDMDWKIKHLKLIMKYALFNPNAEDKVQVSGELAAVLRNSFFTALGHQLSHLENHRMVLISLVYYIDNILTKAEYELRTKLSDEMMSCWTDMMGKIQKIDLKINKTIKKKTAMYIFHTLFLQMSLHIFVDPVVAKNILNELDRCYKKENSQSKKIKDKGNSDSCELEWIEIAVELFLSLLSHDTYLLRQLISRIFPHLCPHLTAQATFQILQVFDPTSNKNILTEGDEDSDEEGSESGEEEEDNDDSAVTSMDDSLPDQEMDEESDSEIEDIDDIEETAIERTRQAVRDALGMAGSVTDTESIDLDDIDEEEGRKLDVALSQAFKNVHKPQNSKNKKQSPNDKALTNFRIRVLDLVDIYLDNNPSLSLVLDTIPALFKLLEFTIKDSHQKPLESRTRSTIKKIGHLKKCSSIEEVEEQLLVDVLNSLMEKGVRSTPVFLDLCNEMSECCTFLLRMYIQSTSNKVEDESLFYNTFVKAVENFFLKRDCLLPISLFENILFKTNWIGNVKLCERIVEFSFNDAVRGFRRNQGLALLCCFYRNTRLLSTLKESNQADCVKLEDKILENATQVVKPKKEPNQPVKPSFISELFSLLCIIKNNKSLAGSNKWKLFSKTVQAFLSNGASSSSISRKCIVKLCSTLSITVAKKQEETVCKKRKMEDDAVHVSQQNGFIGGSTNKINNVDEGTNESSDEGINVDDNTMSDKNIIKKKKSKRKHKKTQACINAKRLRSELANDVEVLKFSETNLSES